jgi:hypothetical protein
MRADLKIETKKTNKINQTEDLNLGRKENRVQATTEDFTIINSD